MTVLPGLWDLHVHLMYAGHPNARYWFDTYTPQFERVIMAASAEQRLMAGVTTVRDLAAPAREILAVKRRIASGELPGPEANPDAVQTQNVFGYLPVKGVLLPMGYSTVIDFRNVVQNRLYVGQGRTNRRSSRRRRTVLPLADVLKDIDRQTNAAADLCARTAAAGVFMAGCPVKTPSPTRGRPVTLTYRKKARSRANHRYD